MAFRYESLEDVDLQVQRILQACAQTAVRVTDLASSVDPIDWMHAIKFKEIGFDGLFERRQNFIEQVNQTFTYLVTLQAIKDLFELHPEHRPFLANPGARSGADLFSEDGEVVAETFAAVLPTNNDKLRKDLTRCAEHQASHRYVFFYSPRVPEGPYQHTYGFPEIAVRRVALPWHGIPRLESGDLTEAAWLRAAAQNPAFDFLREQGEDIYTIADGKAFRDAG